MRGLLDHIALQGAVDNGQPPDDAVEGWVLPGSWIASEGVCQVYVGSTLGLENSYFADGDQPLWPVCRVIAPGIGLQYAPVGGERALIWETEGGWNALLYHGPDDSSPVPAGEVWWQHRKVGSSPEDPQWDAAMRLGNDAASAGDGLGSSVLGGTGALTQSQTASGARHTINDVDQVVETATAGGQVQIFDDVNNAISIIPNLSAANPLVALGDTAANLGVSGKGAINKDILDTLATNIRTMVGNALQQGAKAAIAAGVTNATEWLAGIQAGLPSLSFEDITSSVADLDVPNGSTVVRISAGS